MNDPGYRSIADKHEAIAQRGELRAEQRGQRIRNRVLAEGFPIAPAERRKVVEAVMDVVNGNGSPRDRVSAAKAIIAANQQNVALAGQEINLEEPHQTNVQVNVNVNNNLHALSDAELERLIAEDDGKGS